MKKAGIALTVLLMSGLAQAQTPSDEEVVKLVKKAIVQIKQGSIESSCKQFADPQGGFINGELYVYVHDMNAKMICHATNARLNGKDMIDMRDVDGVYFNKAMVDLAKGKGSGWVHYKFLNPATKTIMPKSSYVERVDDFIVGAGVYRAK